MYEPAVRLRSSPGELPEPEQPEASSAIAYVPLDDRPDNVGRVQYLAESLGYTLNMPEEWMYKTLLDGPAGRIITQKTA